MCSLFTLIIGFNPLYYCFGLDGRICSCNFSGLYYLQALFLRGCGLKSQKSCDCNVRKDIAQNFNFLQQEARISEQYTKVQGRSTRTLHRLQRKTCQHKLKLIQNQCDVNVGVIVSDFPQRRITTVAKEKKVQFPYFTTQAN